MLLRAIIYQFLFQIADIGPVNDKSLIRRALCVNYGNKALSGTAPKTFRRRFKSSIVRLTRRQRP